MNSNQNNAFSSCSFSGSDTKISSPQVDKNSSSLSNSQVDKDRTLNQISSSNRNNNNNSISDKTGKKADKIGKQQETTGTSFSSSSGSFLLNRNNSEPCSTTAAAAAISTIDHSNSQNQQPPHHYPLKSTQSVPTSKTSSSGLFQRFKPKSASVSISVPIATISTTKTTGDHTVVFSNSTNYSQSTLASKLQSSIQQSSPPTNQNHLFNPSNSILSSTTNSSTPGSTNQPQQQTPTAASNQQPEQSNKKTKKRRSFELFNSGRIIRRQHSAHQSSQSSPGPLPNSSTGEQRRESTSSQHKTTQQLPLSVSAELDSSVTNNQGVGGGCTGSARVIQSTTHIEPTNVASSSGSAASTPTGGSFAGVASTVNFARRFLLNRSKTSGLLVSGPSSLADQNRGPHSRTLQELFRGEMSVRRQRSSFRNSLHRFGSSETSRRPIRHHAWAYKEGEWYIAYGKFHFFSPDYY